jgi:hypothetical protein
LVLAWCGIAWSQEPAKPGALKPGAAAQIGDDVVTYEELDAKALGTNMKLAQSVYDARKAALDEIILEKLLAKEAKEKGVSTDDLLQQRVAEKAAPVTDEQIESYYNANQGRMRGQSLEQLSGQLRSYLEGQAREVAKQAVLKELKGKANVRVALQVPRVEVTVAANAPTKGPATAKITIVEISDFQ